MKYTTYIFGAGASCEVLPLNNQIPPKLHDFITKLNSFGYLVDQPEYLQKDALMKDLDWLLQGAVSHASVDTFAKKLYIKQKWKELKILRLGLSVFFACEQMGKIPDKRYDAFLASILGSSINSLPKHLKILNWNYDYQLELSFMGFTDIQNIRGAHPYLGCIQKHRSYFTDTHECFQLFKLNGDISLNESNAGSNTYPIVNDFSKQLNEETLKEILNNWHMKRHNGGDFCSNISFAWERSGNNFLEYACKELEKTEVLVILGYSLPYFNREIDRLLIGAMKRLIKVYIQAPDADDLAERLEAVDGRAGLTIVKRYDTNQFLIPNELS